MHVSYQLLTLTHAPSLPFTHSTHYSAPGENGGRGGLGQWWQVIPPWRLDPSIKIFMSLCSLPVEAKKGSRLGGTATVQISALAACTYLTKTLNGIFLLRGLFFSSCQAWVFQASTFRKESTCEGGWALTWLWRRGARETEDASCPL